VAEIVEAGGAVVAEMPMGWEPRSRDFPRRNRIISGLSYGSVVVEAARRCGSLITARFALEQNREVFAVPGSPLDPRAEGTNDLIRQGATLVAEPEHVLEVIAPLVARGLDPDAAPFRPRPDFADQPDFWEELDLDGEMASTPAEAPVVDTAPVDERSRILALLGPGPVATDELARAAECSVRTVQTVLLELELDGRIERQGSGMVALVRS
jgi:DNA processing protein